MEASQELIHEPLKLQTSGSLNGQSGRDKRSNPQSGVLTAPTLSLRGQAFGMASSPVPTERRISMPLQWRSRTFDTIQLARQTADDSASSVVMGRKNDPLPTLRLQLADLSNGVALKYSRGNREIAVQLRAAMLDVNECVVASNRVKEAMERELHSTRLDLELNVQCVTMRTNRPDAEKDPDRADDMLAVEKQQLQRQKRELENHLQCIQSSLQELSDARRRLAAVLHERGIVTDLLNQHAGAALTLSPNARAGSSVPGEMSATLAGLPADRVSALGTLSARLSRVHNSPRATACRPGGAFSVGTSSGSGSGAGAGGQSLPDSEMVDASGPGPAVLSAETRDALAFANAAIKRANELNQSAKSLVERCRAGRNSAHNMVNGAIQSKLQHNAHLQRELNAASGETRVAMNTARRFHELTGIAFNQVQGPLDYTNLCTSEKLTRPVIRVYQRHPGTQLPEAQYMIKGTDQLRESLRTADQHLTRLSAVERLLTADITNKRRAHQVDEQILRVRRQLHAATV